MAHFISVVVLNAGADMNGNSRRLITILLDGGIACAFSEGGEGVEHTIRRVLPLSGDALSFLSGLVKFRVDMRQYRETLKENPVRPDTDLKLARALGIIPEAESELPRRAEKMWA